MKTPLLVAAVCAGLPGCVVQDPDAPTSPDTAVFTAACAGNSQDNLQRASSALPARASTGPAPQLGTVAPSTRVPSYVVTPSMRAMQRATAAREAQETDTAEKIPASCEQPVAPATAAPTRDRKD